MDEMIWAFKIGNAGVSAYGLTIALAALFSGLLATVCFKKAGLKKGNAATFALIAIPLALFGARLFFCLMRLDYVLNDAGPTFFFRLREGGFVLYGALAGGALAAWLAAKLTGQKATALMDAAAPAAALMIGMARLAEGFAGQGYSYEMAEGSVFAFIPLGTFRAMYEQWYWSVYLLEGLWALGICIFLCLRKGKKPGEQALLLLLYYAAAQVLFESIRADEVLRWGFVRCNQLASALVIGLVLFLFQKQGKVSLKKALVQWGVTLVLLGICMAMEFAREQKITLLMFMTEPMCYATMIASLVLLVCFIRKCAYRK
jgi:Prolipoprotein diacylglyceryltransferase